MTKTDSCWIDNKRPSFEKHHHKFNVFGNRIKDSLDSVKEYDGKGHINSICMVK